MVSRPKIALAFFQKQAHVHAAIERFTGHSLTADFISSNVTSLRNALNSQSDIHFAMDNYLSWVIEAKFVDEKVGSHVCPHRSEFLYAP